ncbi:MAG TPA: hypothetical protein VFP87_06895 [Chitinophagaceae bacterium]|nr:hypothetical protein [Chitinophagaceae bacterium]
MKTTTIALVAISASALVAVTSCKKNSVNTVIKSRTELLTQTAWKYELHGLDENNNGVVDASENDMPYCQTDDIFTFNSNGNGVYLSGDLLCAPDDSTTNFTWSFANNETQLTIFAFPQNIGKLDDNTLEIYYEDQNSTGQTVKYITRFKH